ncbi:MAG: molybdopterin-dependent oxidoreductase [Georgfuchsia sp.]
MTRLTFGGNVRRSICSLCPQQCGLVVEVVDGKATRFNGDKGNPVSAGKLCLKGGSILDFHNHPQRLNFPLKRVGARGENRWEKIGWEQALDEIAAKLAVIRDREGPESLATLGGTHQGPGDWSNWRFACHYGSPNFVSQGRNCGVGEVVIESAIYGWDTKFNFPVAGKTRCVILWGANFPESMPVFWGAVKQCQTAGAKMIVIDPRVTKAARQADLHLQIRPRTDGALALGLIHVLIEEGLYDREFVENWCLGFDQVRQIAAEWTPEKTGVVTGLRPEDIVTAARMYGNNRPARISTGVAMVQAGQGASRSAVHGLAILKAISGNLDIRGGEPIGNVYDPSQFSWLQNVGFDRLLNHPARTRESVNAAHTPICSVSGYRAFRDAAARLYPEGHTACAYMLFADPSAIYHAVTEQDPYPIRAIIAQGGNPLLTMGGGKAAHKAFTSPNLELLVTMDYWLTPTAQLSDYVLPAADFLERPDIIAHWGLSYGFIAVQQAVTPQHERHNDYDLWAGLGRRLLDPAEWPQKLDQMLDRFVAPLAKAAGHDINYIALTGALASIGPQDGPPVPPLNLAGDYGGGSLFLALGILAAQIECQVSGQGQVIDAAIVDGTSSLMSIFATLKANGMGSARRGDNFLNGSAHYYRAYECSDGRFISVGAIEPNFYKLLRDKLATVTPCPIPGQKQEEWESGATTLASIFRTRTQAQWCDLLEGTDACFAPVMEFDEAHHHPHMQARQVFVEAFGMIQPAPAPRFSRTPGSIQGPPPEIGCGGHEALVEWGVGTDRIPDERTSYNEDRPVEGK